VGEQLTTSNLLVENGQESDVTEAQVDISRKGKAECDNQGLFCPYSGNQGIIGTTGEGIAICIDLYMENHEAGCHRGRSDGLQCKNKAWSPICFFFFLKREQLSTKGFSSRTTKGSRVVARPRSW
jgi:hypothetical protein